MPKHTQHITIVL